MSGYEYFEQVLKSKGLKAFDVSRGTGIRSGVFSDWKAGRYTPKIDKLQKIADFLGVPVEPLLGVHIYAQDKEYYQNALSAAVAQEMFDDKQIRALHHIKKNISSERFQAYYDFITRLYQQENPGDSYDFGIREQNKRHEDD